MKITLFSMLLFLSLSVSGQGQKSLAKANKFLESESYDLAAAELENLLKEQGNELELESKLEVYDKLSGCFGKLKQQEKQIEFLNRILEQADPNKDTLLIRKTHYTLIDEIYLEKDIYKALALSLKAEDFEKNYGSDYEYALFLQTTAGIFHYMQQFDKVPEKYLTAYHITDDPEVKFESVISLATTYREERVEYADSLFNLAIEMSANLDSARYSQSNFGYGQFLMRIGKNQKASKKILTAIETKPRSKEFDLSRISCYVLLADIFNKINNIDRASYYIERAVKLAEKRKYSSRNGSVAFTYGRILMIQGKEKLAYQEFLKAEKYFKRTNRVQNYITAVSELGIIDLRNNELSSAEKRYENIKGVLNEVNVGFAVVFESFKALLLLEKKKYNQAILLAEKTYEKCNSNEDPAGKMKTLQILTKAYRATGDYVMALSSLDAFHEIKDSVFQSSQNQIVFDLESQYKRKEQDQSLALLNVENKLSTEKLSRQKFVITIGAIALGLISLLSFFLFSLYKRINNQKQIIQKALSEKDVLLREIHHRVKNNLQLVSSLLTLQSRSITDESAIAAINDGKARVRSMALIHQDLYNKENLTGISVKSYIEKLSKEIFHTYNISEEMVKLDLDVEDIELDVETVVPLGLIINELITNSLKYAFPGNQEGSIEISLKEKTGKLVLLLKDNGIGLDPKEFQNSSSFGNRLVNILTEQLDGSIAVTSENGTLVSIQINSYNIAA